MKLALRLRDPSPDWLAMRKVIEENATLREDVILEVGEDACRFLDGAGREIPTGAGILPQRKAVAGVDAKLKLLTLLHEKFSAYRGSE
jgi:hypothetical protein